MLSINSKIQSVKKNCTYKHSYIYVSNIHTHFLYTMEGYIYICLTVNSDLTYLLTKCLDGFCNQKKGVFCFFFFEMTEVNKAVSAGQAS